MEPEGVQSEMSHSPHGVGAIAGAVFVTDEAIETRGTEPLLAIRAFKTSFTETGSVDMMTLGSILTLTLLVTLQTEAAHRTVILTPGGHKALKFVERNITYFCGQLELSWKHGIKNSESKNTFPFYYVQRKPTSSSLVTEYRTVVEFLPMNHWRNNWFSPHWNIQI